MAAAAGGRGSTTRARAVGGVRRVYEEFMPVSEWQQDDESHILTINLPGFTKEEIKVSTEGENVIRVRGERLVAGNKWSRFQKDFPVQENGDMNSVRAKYQGGSLTVTVQKKKPGKPATTQKAQDPKTASIATKNQDKLLPNLSPPIQTNGRGDDKTMEPRRVLEDQSKTPETNKAASVSENEEAKKKQMARSKETDHGAFKMHDYKKAVKGLSQLNEERQLLVNMGVAVLVIMLLSAYVTYSFTSGKTARSVEQR